MPLTLAHPIAVAPLWYASRKRLDLPAMIIGSMIPDITYFLWLRPVQNIGHTPLGILVQGVPAGLVLLWILFCIMRPALMTLAPRHTAHFLTSPYRFGPPQRFAMIVISIILGAGTHVLWDSFTHEGWLFVGMLPALQAQIGPLPVYKYLQYSSGIFGTIAVVLWARYALRQRATETHRPSQTRGYLIVIAVGATVLALTLLKKAPLSIHTALVQGAIGSIAGVWLGVLVFALWHHAKPLLRKH